MSYFQSQGTLSSKFQYVRLWRDTEVRLVCLHRGSGTEAIECHLKHIQLGWEKEPYEALSYQWGQPSYDDPLITLSESPFRVGKNLHDALLHLRQEDKDRYIWIDALCINQKNGEERNHQVAIMGRIYSGAAQVIVWLGLAESESEVAIDLIKRINKRSHESQDPFPPQAYSYAQYLASETIYGSRDFPPLYNNNELAWPRDFRSRPLVDPRWQALLSLLRRPYWHRMWIIQEIQLAQQLIFHCGPESFDGNALKMVCDFIVSTSEEELASHIGSIARETFKNLKATFAFNLFGRRRAQPSRLNLRLKTWLFDCIRLGCSCSEPRDTIYALLGISKDCQDGELVPDYGKPLVEVYYDAMTVCTRGPPMPEINDYWLATKLASTLDLNLELEEMTWPLSPYSTETLIESCH